MVGQDELAGCRDEGDGPEKLVRFLVVDKGFGPEDIEERLTITTEFNEQVVSKITLVLSVAGRRTLLLRYAPGSVVTRERSAVAAARVLDGNYQIPLVVVTNGVEAVMLDTYKGRKLADSLAQLPSRQELIELSNELAYEPFSDEKKREREKRILNAFDVDL